MQEGREGKRAIFPVSESERFESWKTSFI
jgi:hypothetical protein